VSDLIHRFFSFLKRSARKQSAVQYGSELAFRLSFGMRILIGFVILLIAGFGFLLWVTVINHRGPFYLLFIPASLLAGILFALPGSIVLDERGVRQHYWWGRNKQIPWSDVASAVHDPRNKYTVVYGKNGGTISFSPYLADQGRFGREILAHTQLDDIPENN